MVTPFEGAVLKTPDGSVVAEGFDGYRSTDGTGWLRITGMPEDFPKLRRQVDIFSKRMEKPCSSSPEK